MARSPKLTKRQAAEIKRIKAAGYSASYEQRLIRGVKQGKTRQEARGHKAQEYVIRKEREKQRNEGLTNSQIKSIATWYQTKFNPRQLKEEPTLENVYEFARQEGFEKFKTYRSAWNAARKKYEQELSDGTWSSRGLGYLDLLYEMADLSPHGDITWLYYH